VAQVELPLGLLLGAVGATALFGLSWLATRRLRLVRKSALTAMLLACAGIPAFFGLAERVRHRHALVRWEERIWEQADITVELHDVMETIAWLGNVYVLATAGLVVFLYLAAM
jgi:hypothetical protein